MQTNALMSYLLVPRTGVPPPGLHACRHLPVIVWQTARSVAPDALQVSEGEFTNAGVSLGDFVRGPRLVESAKLLQQPAAVPVRLVKAHVVRNFDRSDEGLDVLQPVFELLSTRRRQTSELEARNGIFRGGIKAFPPQAESLLPALKPLQQTAEGHSGAVIGGVQRQ